MKKKLLVLFAVLLTSTVMKASPVTVDVIQAAGLSASVTLNADKNPYRMGESPITLTGIKGTSNFPALNYNATNGVDLRFYKGTTCGVTFATTDGSSITKIEFKKNASTASNLGTSFSVDEGDLEDNVWTGSAAAVTLTYNSTATFKEQIYQIYVTYETKTPTEVLKSITVSGTPDKKTYEAGEEFDPTGLTVTGTYTEGEPRTITHGITWSVTPETLTAGTTSVSVVAKVGDIASLAYTVNGLTVTEKPVGPAGEYTIDFEDALTTYTDWVITNGVQGTGSITAHGGTYYGTTDGKETTSFQTKEKIAAPKSITCYVSKQSSNTHASSIWYVQVSENGTDWTDVSSKSASSMNKGVWVELSADLSSYSNVYVRIYYSGSTAIRNIDDITLTTGTPSTDPSISASNVNIAADATSGEIAYEITNPVTGKTLTATTDASWISNIQVDADKVTFTTTANTEASERTADITLKYEGATDKVVTVTQKGATVALTTIDQIFAKATEAGSTATEVSVKFDGWYVTGVKGSNAYVTDGTKGFIIYGNGHGFVVGHALTGTVTCKVQLFNGSAELTELTTSTEGLTVTPNHAITAVEKTIDQLSGINTGAVVTIKNITYDGANFTDGTNTIVPYNTLMTLPTFEENGKYNITGVYLQYGGKKEILPRSEADIETLITTKYTITWSVNGTTTDEEVNEGADIEFKPATVPAGFTDYVFRGWTASETVSGTTEPTYVTTATATADITYYAVFAKKTTTGGAASLTKLDGTSTLADGDKLAIFAHVGDNYYGMKHETVSNSYVNYYVLDKEPTYEAVTENDLNWWTLNDEDGNWTLGDDENGYLANSDNYLYADEEAGTYLSISWDSENSAYTIKNGTRWIGCRSDLSGDNKYKFRGASANEKPQSGSSCYLDIYRITTGTVTYSDWTTTLVRTAYTLDIKQTGYSTLYLDKAVEIPEGVTVYYCTRKDGQSLNAVKIESGYVPAYTGVVVETADKKEGTYDFKYTDQQVEDLAGSELNGVLVATPVQEMSAGHNNAPVYVLSVIDEKLGFYKYADTATLKANRAFLLGAEEQPPVKGFILDFNGTEGINAVMSATNLKAGYDIQGRRINQMQKGINILNGKKIIK